MAGQLLVTLHLTLTSPRSKIPSAPASSDIKCMTEHLEVTAEQRLMRRELLQWDLLEEPRHRSAGSTFPLLPLMTGKALLYTDFFNDMLLRGAVMFDPDVRVRSNNLLSHCSFV